MGRCRRAWSWVATTPPLACSWRRISSRRSPGIATGCAPTWMRSPPDNGWAMKAPGDPTHNHLLDVFPTAEYERLAPFLEPVAMPLGQVLSESGGQLQYVYFPTNSIVSLL